MLGIDERSGRDRFHLEVVHTTAAETSDQPREGGNQEDMTDERALEAADRGAVSDVPRDEWSSWCAGASSDHGGRELELHRRDRALGDVCLAAGQRLVAIEHDVFGDSEALTIKYGSAEVPVSCVVVAPQAIEQRRDETGDVREVSIIDIVGRRTRCVLM